MKVPISEQATRIRELIVKMLTEAGSGHSAGALGMADVFASLYFDGVLVYRPEEPWWPERDRVVLSAGHIVPVWYAALATAGFFPEEELETLRKVDSRLQGHPHRDLMGESLPGIENTAGPLAQGTSMAVGMAWALRYKFEKGELGRNPRVFCVMSDGELQEGQTWEALMSASAYGLGQLTFVIDRNHIQISGYTEQVMPVEPVKEKLEAFGLLVIEVDGHNLESLKAAFSLDASLHGKPAVILAHTIPGKGVAYMENLPEWHGKPPLGPGEAVEALKNLRSLGGKVEYE